MANNETKIIITAATAQAEGALKSFGDRLSGVSSQISKFSGLFSALSVVGFAAMIRRSIDATKEYQNALNGLASVARYAGEDISSTLTKSTKLTEDGMLSVAESATALKNLLARGFSTDEAVAMIMRFKDAAAFGRQGSLEFGQAVVSATEGIKNNISNLVDNAGVTKNISVMQKEYAAAIGTTVGKLTEAEQRQAIYAGVLRETEAQLGNAALAANGMQGAQARLNKTMQDAAVEMGQKFTPAAIEVTRGLTMMVSATGTVLNAFTWLFGSIGIGAGELMMKIGALGEFISSPGKWFSSDGRAEFKNKLHEYTALAEQMRIDMAARLNIGLTPQLGKDSGKRRTDVTAPADDTEAKKKLDQIRKQEQSVLLSLQKQAAGYQQLSEVEQVRWEIANGAYRNFSTRKQQELLLLAQTIDAAKEENKAMEEASRAMQRSALEAQAIIADVDPIYKASLAWEELAALVEQGLLTAEQAGASYEKTFAELDKSGNDAFKSLENAVRGWGNEFTDEMVKMMRTGKMSFSSLADSIINDLLRIQVQKNITDPLVKAGTSSLDSFFGGLFGGGKAIGGPVAGGTTYLVGERGPELFTPQVNGNITPNHKLGGTGDVTVNSSVTINAPNASAETVSQIRALMPAFIAENSRVVVGAVNQALVSRGQQAIRA